MLRANASASRPTAWSPEVTDLPSEDRIFYVPMTIFSGSSDADERTVELEPQWETPAILSPLRKGCKYTPGYSTVPAPSSFARRSGAG